MARIKPLTVILLFILFMGSIFYLKSNVKPVSHSDREILLQHVNKLIKSGSEKLATEGQACRVPVLDVNATEIMQLLKEVPKVVCNGTKDWVEITGSTLKITNWARKKFGHIKCLFTEIIRENDYRQHEGMITASFTEYNLETTDIVQVTLALIGVKEKDALQAIKIDNIHAFCRAIFTDIATVELSLEKGINIAFQEALPVSWQKVFMGIRSDQEIFDRSSWSKLPKDSLKLNVLMFGFDSLSHNMWKRKLPKAYHYATNDLKGIALNGYNIVGDGTPQALIPILTGRTELELPDTRKRKRKSSYVNIYPFIWNDFRDNGYVTAWSEDLAQIGTFNYRLRGFNEQPVDHYMRSYFLEALPFYEREKKFCYGGLSRFQIVLQFVRNIYEVYKTRPKFIFTFHSEYSHDSNDWIANADEDLTKWLQEFNYKGYLNDTLLILMSDHGSRFADIRNTQQGKLEERLPGFIFIFPSWFEKKYPEAYRNFKINADRLTTPFDIHETLADVLHFQGPGMGDVLNRGISLFKEIPLLRSCRDAAIEPHWCTCLNWETVPVTDPIVSEAVAYLLNFLNKYTSPHRDLCEQLNLKKVLWSAKLIPNEQILKFKRNSDYDGFVGDMSDHTAISVEIYQLKVSFKPGNMIFEASIRYYTGEKKFLVSESEISRINRYRHMTHCIEDADILHHLRKFCNCRSNNRTN